MNSIKHRFTLDMHSVQSQISIPASINDTARTLYINFTDGGNPYHISEGCTALLIISKPSSAKLEEWCAIKDNANVIYPFSQNKNTASEEGICECEITLYSAPDEDGEIEQIASPRFSIVVSERAINRGDDEVLPEAAIGFIDQAVKDELVRRQKEQERQTAENARVSAEAARAGAETARANAESARATAETERASVESARKTAENARASAETARASAETQRIANEEERQRNSAEYKAQVDLVREEIETWQDEWGKISSFDKRIENLEAAVSPGLVTPTIDDTIAYRKTVPNGVLPNAAVCEVGGMSYKCENLLDMSALDSKTISGVTFTKNSNGTYTASGTSTAAISVALHSIEIANTEKMWLSGGTRLVMLTANAMLNNAFVQSLVTVQGTTSAVPQNITYDKIALYLVINKGVTLTNETFYGMLNAGSTALPYQPYFTGLRDSKVTAVESVGANLIPFPYNSNEGKINGINWTAYPDGTVVANGTADSGNSAFYLTDSLWLSAGNYTISGVPASAGYNATVTMYCVDDEGQQIPIKTSSGEYSYVNAFCDGALAITLSRRAKATIYTQVVKGATYSNLAFKPMLNRGSTALPYSPYLRESLPIPADALDGFGQGVSKDCYNKIVLDPLEGVKKYVNKAKTLVLDGATNKVWYVGETNGKYYASFTPSVAATSGTNFVSSHFTKKWADELGNIYIDNWGNFTMFNTDQSLTSVAKWNEWLQSNNITICYELATPTETDVSTLFADDNLLPVEAGGTITAVNEYEQAVPTSIEYTVKGA